MTPAEREAVLHAFNLGLGRQALPPVALLAAAAPEARALAALALAGQQLRLAQPSPTRAGGGWRLPDDPAPLLPEVARAALRRAAEKIDLATASGIAPLLWRQLAAAGHRLHPFDLPHLGPLLRGQHHLLGPVERAWLDRDARAPAELTLTAENWREGASADRVRFLRGLRRADPAAGRALLEAAYPAETAKLRGDLLLALGTGLGLDDKPFLEACAVDRAAGVKQAARDLLAQLPGSEARQSRLAGVRAAISIKTGLLGRNRRLVCHAPAQAGRPAAPLQLLDRIGLSELASALGVAAADLPGLADDDEWRQALAACALRDGAVDTALGLLGQMGNKLWPGDVEALGVALTVLSPSARQDVAERALRPDCVIAGDWRRLGLFLAEPLAPATADRLLGAPAWAAYIAGLPEGVDLDATLLPIAALIPAALATACAATLAAIPPARRPRATALLAFLAELAHLGTPA